jgi:hypothetical protein
MCASDTTTACAGDAVKVSVGSCAANPCVADDFDGTTAACCEGERLNSVET